MYNAFLFADPPPPLLSFSSSEILVTVIVYLPYADTTRMVFYRNIIPTVLQAIRRIQLAPKFQLCRTNKFCIMTINSDLDYFSSTSLFEEFFKNKIDF